MSPVTLSAVRRLPPRSSSLGPVPSRAFPHRAPATGLTRRQRQRLFRAVLFAMGGLLALFALAQSASAQVLIIPENDGYGFDECLTTKSACGAVVADAWCEANGLKASKAFGRAEDFSAPPGEERPADIRPGSFFVACGEKI
ncbi:hypothetical protein Msil_0134 [Methylocella silvestris BL2]|uniref:Uncharacterized protein n=1 Tax=Methylocella silvestris (strain DSM 15510 / CIP 108128 / LMG 27833 / NCIMB 13906 / BL2) TaxID=395965 RepID=B8EMY1_METSB|nr:hypothetical protein [Methylocella silvestris]ACK49116.1 hypothetical protein Msil_0134 [Methylocella silvestris BL2]